MKTLTIELRPETIRDEFKMLTTADPETIVNFERRFARNCYLMELVARAERGRCVVQSSAR